MPRKKSSKSLEDAYLVYKKLGKEDISYAFYKKIISLYIKLSIEAVIKQGYAFAIPQNMGILKMLRRKNKDKLKIDYHRTKITGKTVYHLNTHTNFYYYRFFWTKPRLKEAKQYLFIPVKSSKQTLKDAISEGKAQHKYSL